MTIFQKTANWIKTWKLPAWLKRTLEIILHDVLIPVLKEFSEEQIGYIENAIISEASKDIPGDQKIKNVLHAFKAQWDVSHLTNSMINLAIEILLQKLKRRDMID